MQWVPSSSDNAFRLFECRGLGSRATSRSGELEAPPVQLEALALVSSSPSSHCLSHFVSSFSFFLSVPISSTLMTSEKSKSPFTAPSDQICPCSSSVCFPKPHPTSPLKPFCQKSTPLPSLPPATTIFDEPITNETPCPLHLQYLYGVDPTASCIP